MYEKITEQRAEEVAQTLIDRMHDKRACAGVAVNKNWEANLEDTGNGNVTLYIYERLDENMGFILSSTFACACTVDVIALTMRNHINACIDEWIAEDVAESAAEMPNIGSGIEEKGKGEKIIKSTVFSFLPEKDENQAELAKPILAIVTVRGDTDWTNFKNGIDDSIASYIESMPDAANEQMVQDVLSQSGAIQFEIIHPIGIKL